MLIADVIAVNVADQEIVKLTETRISHARHRAPRIIEYARAVFGFIKFMARSKLQNSSTTNPKGVTFTSAAEAGCAITARVPTTIALSQEIKISSFYPS